VGTYRIINLLLAPARMSITLWRRLSTPAKQLIILLLLVLVVALFSVPLGIMSMRRVQTCLDQELYHQTLALRGWFIDKGYNLKDEAKLLSEFDAFGDALATHDDVQIRRLMTLYQSAHEADGVYLILRNRVVYSSSVSPPLPGEAVAGLDMVRSGGGGQSLTGMVTLDEKIWMMSVAPHIDSVGGIDGVFLIVQEIDSAFLDKLARGMNGSIVLTDGEVFVKSYSGPISEAVSNALRRAKDSQTEAVLQPITVHYDSGRYRALVVPLETSNSGVYAIAVTKNADIVDEALWLTLRWSMAFGLVALVLIVLLVQFHVVEIFRPLRSLVVSTKRIAAGDLDEPLAPTGVAEVYELALNFETMRSRLKALLERERSLSESLEMQVQETSQALDDVCRARENLLAQLISSQEEERRRVSRELHDETSQALANLIVRLGTLSRTVDDENVLSQLQMLRSHAAETLEGVNRIVMDLRPGLLDEYGLVPAVQWYADARLTSQGIPTQVKVSGTPRELSSYAQASVYRAIQEAINNIAQHAQASEVMIRIAWQEEQLWIEIQDDGRGFDLDQVCHVASGRYGLLGMKERIILLGGVMDVQTSPGEGVLLVLQIPYSLNTMRNDGRD